MPRDERRARIRMGLGVTLGAFVLFVVLFLVGQAEGAFAERTEVYADFAMTSGLRVGSPVQLAGVEIGRVSDVDYVNVSYACDPLTEDVGRYGAGRTDNCDKRLFCTPHGQCGALEPMADDFRYERCVDNDDCGQGEICITTEFRRREPRVLWMGPNGVCGRYATLHHRVRVEMNIEAVRLPLIRRDSEASIASNSVLGDQLINITPGIGDPVGEQERILTTPSLAEDVELYRLRLERVIEKTDEALAAISGLVAELGDERTIEALKGLVANLEKLSLAVAERRGLIGALVGEPTYKRDFGMILHALGATTAGVDRFVGKGNSILATADRNLEPLLEDVRATTQVLRALIGDLRDPANRSVVAKLIDDPDGTIVADLEAILSQTEQITSAVASITAAVKGEKGTVGKLLGDPKLADDLGRLLDNLQSNETLTGLLLWALEQSDVGIKASRSPSGPPRSRRRAARP
ncbi:MAG: MCE family protein [Myxococcales bacterium]|nr:MCE family protein [Myxococcales bacterium]